MNINGSEIILRSLQFCNLSEIVARSTDTLEDLLEKAKIATIIGTLQSTLTNLRYLRKEWNKNCEEERLLGVSITGIMDHPVLSKRTEECASWLQTMKQHCIEINKEWTKLLNIPESSAITCVKPSGTVSQLVDSASGIHPRYSKYYIRRVRSDKKDPLANLMINQGVPHETDFYNNDAWVFSFPIKAPTSCITRDEVSAIDQLELWKHYQENWCEHKASITVYVKENEWLKVGSWVYENFDMISGISFLPHSEHSYVQAPYEEIDEITYHKLLKEMPKIDWSKITNFEKEDHVENIKELACSAGSCEI